MINFLRSIFSRPYVENDQKDLSYIVELRCSSAWWGKVEKMAKEYEVSPAQVIDAAVNLLEQELNKINSTEDT